MSTSVVRPEHPIARSLTEFVAAFGLDGDPVDGVEVSGVTLSTSAIEPGDLYVGMPGRNVHGASFAGRAEELGAVAVLTDETGAALAHESSGLPVIVTESPREALGEVAAWVYRTGVAADPHEEDDEGIELFGVTGTDGKTSTVYLLDALLRQLGVVTGLTSTAERRIGDDHVASELSTPEASELHGLLARMREVGVRAASIEVSAQAVTRHRIDGIVFDVVGFTNLSHDHLEDYADMGEYLEAKAQLFTPERARRGVVSLDSEYGQRIVDEARIPVTTISLSPDAGADWTVHATSEGGHTRFRLVGPEHEVIDAQIPLPGRYMAANAGLAIVMLIEAGHSFEHLKHVLEANGTIDVYIPGRTELVSGEEGPRFYVDYGHTPAAFANTLAALREFTTGRIIMIFGADGDRDATKRFEMGKNAGEGADIVIVTDYNPRFEDPDAIRRTLLDAIAETSPGTEVHEVPDPRAGIRLATQLADEHDTILIAGPGHESYMEVRGERIPYSARDEARDALREAGWAA